MYRKGEVDITYGGDIVIHGGHFSKEEAQAFLKADGYDEIVVDVEHTWATWGFVPDDVADKPEDKMHGWWFIEPNDKYKHRKKMTVVEV